MTTSFKRASATLAATALVASGLAFGTVTPAGAQEDATCVATDTITLLGFNDFHGRIVTNRGTGILPMATAIEDIRAAEGADNVVVLSSGDNVGATIFESMVTDDAASIQALNALGLDASAVGNHELDKGWTDLSGRIIPMAEFPYLAANMQYNGGSADPVEEYTIVTKGGIDIAIVGAITTGTPGLVSPAGIQGLTFSDEAAAINRVTEQIFANDEADIVVASIHEGASDAMMAELDDRLAAVFTAHTHEEYVKSLGNGAAVVQAKSYAEALAQIVVEVDAETGEFCSSEGSIIDEFPEVNTDYAVVSEINTIVEGAKAEADEVGLEVIGEAEAAISTPDGGSNVRDTESPMTNMVAQMFFDVGGADADSVIGVQNPGGTRSSFDAGDITYKEAANTLPFANSLFSTELTGAQVVQVLEEQWQRDADGVEYVPAEGVRPFLQLGLSDNVSYTYDASLPLDERITSVSINGQPIDLEKTYTMVSGSFLISGGDQFYTFADGKNMSDTGRADLEAWVEWVEANSPLSPDYSKRGVAADLPDTALVIGGAALTYEFSNLDMNLVGEGDNVSPKLANSKITAYIGNVVVGTGTVADGAGTVSISLPAGTSIAKGTHTVRFLVEASGTEIFTQVDVLDADEKPRPGLPSTGR